MENVADCLLLEIHFQRYMSTVWYGNQLIDAAIERGVWVKNYEEVLPPWQSLLEYIKQRDWL